MLLFIRLLNGNLSSVLPLTDNTMQCLHQKHPKTKQEEMLLEGPVKLVDGIIYDHINATLIRKCAIKTKGAAGPSGLDANFWRKIIGGNVFGAVSDDLCHAIAIMTRKLCTELLIDPDTILPLISCRLIALDKCPGLHPIGIGEVLRRIMGKAVMSVFKRDVIESAGYEHLCAGIEAWCEVAIHATRDLFMNEDTWIYSSRCNQCL